MTSVVRELECPASRAISSTGTPDADSKLTKLVRNSRGVQSSPIPAALQMALNCRLTLLAPNCVPTLVVKQGRDLSRTPQRPASLHPVACGAAAALHQPLE